MNQISIMNMKMNFNIIYQNKIKINTTFKVKTIFKNKIFI